MILNDVVNAIYSDCLLRGAPNETVTLINIETTEEKSFSLNSEGELRVSSLNYGIYVIKGSKSIEALPEGRLVLFNEYTENTLIDGKRYRILSAYPDNTWFWFGKQFGTWQGSQYVPGSKPFIENTYYQDEKIKETVSIDKTKGCLKIYSQSTKKDKAYGWTGNIASVKQPKDCNRICFLANASLNGSKIKNATVGLGFNIANSTKTDLGDKYNFFLQAQVSSKKEVYMADVSRYRGQNCMPVAFIANDSTKDETVISSTLEIYAIWMDEIVAEGGGETEKITWAPSQTLRSEILATAGNRWQKAFSVTTTGENFVGRSTDYGATGMDTNSSMAIPLVFDFYGNSKKLKLKAYFYLPYAPWTCYWAISTNLEPYRAKSISQNVNGFFPEVTNDSDQIARGEYTINEESLTMEFPCTSIPKNSQFYLIFYSKVEKKYGAIHARGTLEAWVEYGVDR